MYKQIAALAAAFALGGAGTAAVFNANSGMVAKPKYTVHAVDVRVRGTAADGGVAVGLKAYGKRHLADGGRKDVGGFDCPASPQIDSAGADLLVATEACIRETP
jgi:hypothetical protein